jgi:hypothetical protein
MTTSNLLPTELQKKMLCQMIHYAFVEMRILGWDGKSKQVADLADAFHNLPTEMYGIGSFNWTLLRGMLQDYQDKYHGEKYSGKRNYTQMLDEIRESA